eukprot:6278-Heterococcus_DN1.PRE.3
MMCEMLYRAQIVCGRVPVGSNAIYELRMCKYANCKEAHDCAQLSNSAQALPLIPRTTAEPPWLYCCKLPQSSTGYATTLLNLQAAKSLPQQPYAYTH